MPDEDVERHANRVLSLAASSELEDADGDTIIIAYCACSLAPFLLP